MTTSAEASRHHVTRFAPSALAVPHGYGDNSHGYRRSSHIDRRAGATHTGLGTCQLDPGGSLAPHVHSYEESLYVVAGSMVLTIDGESVIVGPDDCAFVPLGSTCATHNPGPEPCRWIDLQSPQARPPHQPPDTFWVGGQAPIAGVELDIRDPRTRRYFHWDPAQHDLDALKLPSQADTPTVSSSMSSALMAYSGITVKMLIDERHGAYLGNLFMVDYQPRVILHPHDHTVEEAFYMLAGEVEYTADGERYVLREGDVAYAGVGCVHAFVNQTDVGCRWLETRAPLPPLNHEYRFERDWDYLRKQLSNGSAAYGIA
jgi:quercetin dioxygenase-like cupin family protein